MVRGAKQEIKVFVLSRYEPYDGSELLGVYSTRAKAEVAARKKRMRKKNTEIEEMEVQ